MRRSESEKVFDAIKSFVEEGNDFANSSFGGPLLCEALSDSYIEVAKYLVEHGANVDQIDHRSGNTALMLALELYDKSVFYLIAEKGIAGKKDGVPIPCDINGKGNRDVTALMKASQLGLEEIVRYLVSRGAKLDEKDQYGWSALMYAACEGHTEIVRFLFESDPNGLKCLYDENDHGENVIGVAYGNEHKGVVCYLAQHYIANAREYGDVSIQFFFSDEGYEMSDEDNEEILNTVIPFYTQRAVDDPAFAFAMDAEISEIVAMKRDIFHFTARKKLATMIIDILEKLRKTLRSIDYTDHTGALEQANDPSGYDMEL